MASKRTVRSVLTFIHLWSGLILFVPLIVLGLTGSVLVFHHEIMDWQAGDMVKASDGPARPIPEIIEAAQKNAPENLVPAFLSLPGHPGEAARVRFVPEGGNMRGPGGVQVYIDPATLEVRGTSSGRNALIGFIHNLHASLMLGRRTGRSVVGWLGVVMFVLGASGLVMWWPSNGAWKAAFTVKWRASALRLNRDLHGAVGIWMLIVFLTVTVTGIYLCFPQTMGSAVRAALPGEDPRAVFRMQVKPIAGAEPMPHADAIALAQQAVPDVRILNVVFPTEPQRPLRVRMGREGYLHGAPAITVMVDPWARKIAAISDPKDFTAGETIQAWQRGLHGGEGLGWAWKVLVFLSGLLPLLFSITGIAMWWIKRRRRQGSRAGADALRVPGE